MRDDQTPTEVTVTLPDGTELTVPSGATIEDVAYEIGPGLGRDAVAGKLDGELVPLETQLTTDATIEIITEDSPEYRSVLRHSAAHIFAQALHRTHPEAKLAIGPWTDDGFYYDIANVSLDEDALEQIQAEMDQIIDADYEIERIERSHEAAREQYSDNRFKREILDEEAADEDIVTFYRQDDWEDLCKGPHVSSTGEVPAIELLDISAAYWRGDETNETLTRVYGTAYESEDALEEYLTQRAKAEKRDHRRLGEELDLFSIPTVTGPGLPLYHPNGKRVLNELKHYVNELNENAGYEPTETPHVFRTELWKESGHYDNYHDDMFLLSVNDEEYGLKPMNCPGHAIIYRQGTRSYRDLPVRYYEHGKVYRKEQRGELSGLSRVWAFTIDDGHVFVRPDQIDTEVNRTIEMILDVLTTFDLEYDVALATRPDQSVGSDEIWERAETQLQTVLDNTDMDYAIEPGDGAFYGPKIDFAFQDALGRDWDGPTVQLDFNMPERLDLTYTGEDNEPHRPVLIHRALYGSYERFFMVLIEHFNGKFPFWLAPEQIRILPISDTNLDYATEIQESLSEYRVSIEDRSWTIGRKIREAHTDRVPYMIVIGDDEESSSTISIRDREEREQDDVTLDAFKQHLQTEHSEKHLSPTFLA